MLKAVIFDLDGVIVDSEPMHAKANIKILKKYGIEVNQEYCLSFVGTTLKRMIDVVNQDYDLCISPEEWMQESTQTIEQIVLEEGYTAIPYVKDLIHSISKEGLLLAIASSSTLESIHRVLDYFSLTKYFNKIISGATVPSPKPAPDVFLKAANELSISPEDCLVIEDSQVGTIAAKNANMVCIGYVNPSSGNQNLSQASICIKSFEFVDVNFLHQVWHNRKGTTI